jgi:hypothetical protein
MKRMAGRVLAASFAVAVLGGCAAAPKAVSAAGGEKPVEPANCVRETGTRITLPEGSCVTYIGRVVTSEQIRSSGAINTGEALKILGI